LDDLSVQQVATRALDRCAAGASTWTRHTVQEHVTRITTEHGVRATGEQVREFVDIATRLALEDCLSVLPPGTPRLDHVAHLTLVQVVRAETRLRDLLHTRATGETEPPRTDLAELVAAYGLDEDQAAAAAAVASADPLVVVEGAAGAGKTTMLAAAIQAAERDGRRARVVAPTKKAADVARTELGVAADSVAALVYAHGWRWDQDGVWTRLRSGDIDPVTGIRFTGPPLKAHLMRGERVIVDEAGMLDQDTAIALLTVADEAQATVALVGDRAQLPAVGRGGVLDMAAHIQGSTFDMTGVHRFTDPAYADLTLRIRDGRDPNTIFDQLHHLGLIQLHEDEQAMRDHIAERHGQGVAVTVATNDEARVLNERIREQRVRRGQVDDGRTGEGSDGLDIGAGDVIQTRKNYRDLQVANRQTWIVQHIADDGTVWAKEAHAGRKRQHTVALPAAYVNEHVHLAYATTAYGVQGATTNASHTVVSEALDAAGVYVGMTRGRDHDTLHIVADDIDQAREQFTTAMGRDRADRGLRHATRRAMESTRGLIEDGPVALVNAELAALDQKADHAQHEAEHWAGIAKRLDAQAATHREEAEESDTAVFAAEQHAAAVRADVTEPLTAEAETEGRDYLEALAAQTAASARLQVVGRFAAGRARRDVEAARQHTVTVRGRVCTGWGTVPGSHDGPDGLARWAEHAAAMRADRDSRVVAADQAVTVAKTTRDSVMARQANERLALLEGLNVFEAVRRDPTGYYQRVNPRRQAAAWQNTADHARGEAARLRALPPTAAARRIKAQRAAEAAQQAASQPTSAAGHQTPSSRDQPGFSP
jgi:hypothetical protein